MIRNSTLSYQNTQTAIIATGNSGAFNLPFGDYESLSVGLFVTTATGTTPTLDLWLQVQGPDGNFYDVYRWAQQTAATTANNQIWVGLSAGGGRLVGTVGSKTIAVNTLGVPLLGRTMQLAWTVAGTSPSFTFSVNIYSPEEDHGSL